MVVDPVSTEALKRNPLFRVLAFLDDTGTQTFDLQKEVDPTTGAFVRPKDLFAEGTPINDILSAGLFAFRENIAALFTDLEERHALLEIVGWSPSEGEGGDEEADAGHIAAPSPAQPSKEAGTTSASPATEGTALDGDEVSPQPLTEVAPAVGGSPANSASSPQSNAALPTTSSVVSPPQSSSTIDVNAAAAPVATSSNAPTDAEKHKRNSEKVSHNDENSTRLPRRTRWSERMLCPHSFAGFVDRLESGFPMHLLCRLQEVLGIPATSAQSSSPLAEQYLIDAIDRWMSSRPPNENDRMVLACGVQPTVLEAAHARAAELPNALIDFVVDVLFPTTPSLLVAEDDGEDGVGPESRPPPHQPVVDWVVLSYEKNREAIDVEDEITDSGSVAGSDNDVDEDEPLGDAEEGATASSSPSAKRARREGRPKVEDSGLAGWTPEDGELVLTEDNIGHFMRTQPNIIPKDILRAHRRPWTSPVITEFELENHFTAAELRSAVKEIAALPTAGAGESDADATAQRAALEAAIGHTIPDALIARAAKVTKKADFVRLLLDLHPRSKEETTVEDVNDEAV